MLKLKNLRSQCLAKGQDSTAAELVEVNLLAHILAYLVVWLNLLSFRKGDFLVFILYLTIGNNYTVAINLEVTLVWVHDNIEVFVTTENLSKHVAETFLQHTYQSSTVDILGFFKLAECINHTRS